MSSRTHRWHLWHCRTWAPIVTVAALALAAPAWAAARPDAWITTKAKISLLTTADVSGRAIHVDTTDGRVTLHGTVGSEQEKQKAAQLARGIEGARDVRNLLQVVPEQAKDTTKVSDSDLKTRVAAALKADQALRQSSIRVESVNAGVVLLDGDAKSLSAHRRAIEVAARVPGVARIESSIESPDELADAEIWQEGSADAPHTSENSAARDMWITSAAKLRLMANSDTPALEINVDTSDGIVTLLGTVPSQQSKQAAADEVRRVSGVRNVQNDLQIVAESKAERVAAEVKDVKAAIETRLEARSDLEDADIDVEVSGGVARHRQRFRGSSRPRALHPGRYRGRYRTWRSPSRSETPTAICAPRSSAPGVARRCGFRRRCASTRTTVCCACGARASG